MAVYDKVNFGDYIKLEMGENTYEGKVIKKTKIEEINEDGIHRFIQIELDNGVTLEI